MTNASKLTRLRGTSGLLIEVTTYSHDGWYMMHVVWYMLHARLRHSVHSL
jgi:hypothetical protein